MVWRNPVTGEDSLQVHGQGAFKLFLKNSPEGEETVVNDLKEVRAFLHKFVAPMLFVFSTNDFQIDAASPRTKQYLCS
jgi:hypothetical protein